MRNDHARGYQSLRTDDENINEQTENVHMKITNVLLLHIKNLL